MPLCPAWKGDTIPAAPDHPQLLITARVSMPRLCLPPWHRARSPPGAHGPPAPPASRLFCKPLCKTRGPTGTGWAWGRHTAPGQPPPHPQTEGSTGARMGGPLATFPSPCPGGVLCSPPLHGSCPNPAPTMLPDTAWGGGVRGVPAFNTSRFSGCPRSPGAAARPPPAGPGSGHRAGPAAHPVLCGAPAAPAPSAV